MRIISLLITLIIAQVSYAITSPELPVIRLGEGWIKLTCKGVTSPRMAQPTVEREIMIGHIKINPNAPYPSFEDLRDLNSNFFKDLTDQCTQRRRARVEMGSFTGTWLDWATDWAYSRLEMSEEFITRANLNLCRQVGRPCESNTQCCGNSNRQATCNLKVKTCETLVIREFDNAIKSSL